MNYLLNPLAPSNSTIANALAPAASMLTACSLSSDSLVLSCQMVLDKIRSLYISRCNIFGFSAALHLRP